MTKKQKIEAKIKELRNIQKIDSPSLRETHDMIDDVAEDILKVLDEQIKINDILNWEEGKEYHHHNLTHVYRFSDGEFQSKSKDKSREWEHRTMPYELLLALANGAEPYNGKEYYLVIPEIKTSSRYLNVVADGVFISDKYSTMYVKTQFTEEEIEELKAKYPKISSILEKVEVEESEERA